VADAIAQRGVGTPGSASAPSGGRRAPAPRALGVTRPPGWEDLGVAVSRPSIASGTIRESMQVSHARVPPSKSRERKCSACRVRGQPRSAKSSSLRPPPGSTHGRGSPRLFGTGTAPRERPRTGARNRRPANTVCSRDRLPQRGRRRRTGCPRAAAPAAGRSRPSAGNGERVVVVSAEVASIPTIRATRRLALASRAPARSPRQGQRSPAPRETEAEPPGSGGVAANRRRE
jgi:hypothetical protein